MIMTLVTKYGGKNSTIPGLRFLLTYVRVRRLFTYRWITWRWLKYIKIQERQLEIAIPKSKTDQHKEGHVVYISRIKSECCPVKYLEVYLQIAKLDISNDNENFLICCIFKTKSGHKVSKTKGFHISELGKFLKATYQRLRRHSRILVCTVLDQVVHHQQPITASQIGWYLNKVVDLQRK